MLRCFSEGCPLAAPISLFKQLVVGKRTWRQVESQPCFLLQPSALPFVCCPLAGRSHGLIPTSTINRRCS